jgi:hypothetical protein
LILKETPENPDAAGKGGSNKRHKRH